MSGVGGPGRLGAGFGLGTAAANGPRRFTRIEAITAGALVALVVGVAVGFAVLGHPAVATRASVFGGSAVIDDSVGGPVVVDLADGSPTLRLTGVAAQVGAAGEAEVAAVGLGDGTLLLDRQTGTVNFVGPDQLVVAPKGAGVALPGPADAHLAHAYRSGDKAFVTRQGPTSTTVSLVGRATVSVAALLEDSATTGATPASQHVPVAAATIGPMLSESGTAVAADGGLWVLVQDGGPGAARLVEVVPARHWRTLEVRPVGAAGVVHQSEAISAGSPPPGGSSPTASSSAPGVARKTVVAALASVRRPSLGQSSAPPTTVVALATATSIRLLAPQHLARPQRTISLRSLRPRSIGSVEAIEAVRGAVGSALFAYQTQSGWYLVGADLATGRQIGPVRVTGPAGTGFGGRRPPFGLLDPVDQGGTIFALVQATQGARPVMVRIDARRGQATVQPLRSDPGGLYPLVAAEQPVWQHGQILVDGPRVIFNNPDSELAVIVFTNEGDRAKVIDKGSAVDINPSAPPSDQVLPRSTAKASAPSPPSSKSSPTPVRAAPQPVDPALACRTSQQKPNVPQVAPPRPATHAVTLSWTYPLIDPEDCEPSSYTVSATALDGAPQPSPSTVAVTGQTALVFGGLRSSTTYRFVVTAYINHSATSSNPVDATTSAEGPNPPSAVTATANGTTGWSVTWQPCAGTCPSNEPAGAYSVIGRACAGSFIGQPPTVQAPAGASSAAVPFSAEPGLLGSSMTFIVQPIGANGLLGAPSAPSACVEGWREPEVSAITLDAAEPPPAPGSTTATAVLTVTPSPGAAEAGVFGSGTTDFVFSVGGHSQPPTTSPRATFTGLQPGAAETTQVTIYPAGFPRAAVVVDGPSLTPTVPWPADLAMTASAHVQSFVSGTVTATFHDAFGAAPPGTALSLQASGAILCANEETPVRPTAVQRTTGTDGQLALSLSLFSGDLGGQCTLQVSLSEVGTDIHGGPSPVLTAGFDAGRPGGFSATWDPPPQYPYDAPANVVVTARGDAGSVTGWTATVISPSGCDVTGQSPTADDSVPLALASCVSAAARAMSAAGETSASFDVTVEVSWSGPLGLGSQSEQLTLAPETLTSYPPSVPSPPTTSSAPGSTKRSSGSSTGSSSTGSSGAGSSSPASGGSAPGSTKRSSGSSTGSSSTGSSGAGSSSSGPGGSSPASGGSS